MDDVELVARARSGDRAAFGQLVERHRAAVYRAARAALGSDREADDVAQEACLTAYHRLGSFNGNASFRTWLLTITWNRAINQRRAMSRWWRRLATHGATGNGYVGNGNGDLTGYSRSPEDALGDRELYEAVRAEIKQVSSTLRDALLLAQTGDYTYADIGQMLGVAEGTIKWRVSEARRLIRRGLEARGFHHEG